MGILGGDSFTFRIDFGQVTGPRSYDLLLHHLVLRITEDREVTTTCEIWNMAFE